ncbi:MAG: chorismate mutase [Microgenomates group bacterium]
MDRLDELRKKIDALDGELLLIISKRLEVVTEVGKIKKELGVPPLDSVRWSKVLEKGLAQADALGLRRDFIKKILDTIHEEALQIEQ